MAGELHPCITQALNDNPGLLPITHNAASSSITVGVALGLFLNRGEEAGIRVWMMLKP